MNKLFTLILICAGGFASAQTIEFIDSIKNEYPEREYIYLKQNKDVLFDLVDGELKMSETSHDQMLFLTDKAPMYSGDKVHSSHFFEVDEVKAFSKSFNGKKYKKKKVKYFYHQEEISEDFFYDDIESISFEYPNLKENGITDLTVKTILKQEYFAVSHFFSDFTPCLERKLIVRAHKDIEVGISKFNFSDDIIYTTSTDGEYVVHQWEQTNQDYFEYYKNAPNPRYYLPHLYARVKTYQSDTGVVNVLNEVDDLYDWYYSLIKKVDVSEDKTLKAITLDIIEGLDDDNKKVETIFKWVQKNIKYIAVEDGLGGFIPRNPKDVCQKRYGDCKDMATIIVDMLRYAGLKGHQVWVGSRDIPYTYEEVISPSVDNHMIAAYFDSVSQEYIYLDATNQFIPYGMPTGFIQGKEVLIRQDSNKYIIEQVPVIAAESSLKKDVSRLTIDGTKLIGKGQFDLTGYYYDLYHYFFSNVNSADDFKSILSSASNKGSNKYKIVNYSRNDKPDQVNFQYNYELDDYIQVNNDEIYINLNLLQTPTTYGLFKEDRKIPIEKDFKNTVNYQFELEVPAGYKVDYKPDNTSFTNDKFSFEINYTVKDNLLIYEIVIVKNYLLLSPEDFEEYKVFVKKLKANYKESIVLKKI